MFSNMQYHYTLSGSCSRQLSSKGAISIAIAILE
jgi:hypothetical protein